MRRSLRVIRVAGVTIALAGVATALSAATAGASLAGPFMGCSKGIQGQQSAHGLKMQPHRCGWWPYRGFSANSGNFRAIHWSSWRSHRARATATAYGTQMGNRWHTHVKLTLSHPITCYGIYRLFANLKVSGPYGAGQMAHMRCSDIEDQG